MNELYEAKQKIFASDAKRLIKTIQDSKIDSLSREKGVSAELRKEVASKVLGPAASLEKKVKETDTSRTFDPTIGKDVTKIEDQYKRLIKKVADAISKEKAAKSRYDAAQIKAKTEYDRKKQKEDRERKGLRGAYATESFKDKVKGYLGRSSLNEMAMKHFAPEAEKKFNKDELKELFNKTSVDSLAKTYVRNARKEGMEDKKIAQGLGATLRNIEDKEKVAKVKEAVKSQLTLSKTKKPGDPGDYDKKKDRPDAGEKAKPSFLNK